MKKNLFIIGAVILAFSISMSCGTSSPTNPGGPTPTPCETFVFGYPAPTSSGVTASSDSIFTSKYTLGTAAKITGFSFNSNAASGSVIFAIFSDNSNSPDILIAQTAFTAITATGQQMVNLASPVNISAGDYWLACLPNNNMVRVDTGSTGGSKYISSPANGYGAILSPFSANGTIGSNSSYYVTVTALVTCQ